MNNGKEKRIVVFSDSAGLIDPECISAFKELGHQVKTIPLLRNPQNPDMILPFNLIDRIAEILSFEPDIIFTINGIGLDNNGVIVRICNLFKIPLVCWYVDKPFYLDQWTDDIIQPYTFFFLFDKSYEEGMKQKGADLSFHLPLATNPKTFADIELSEDEISRFSADVVFVGRSEAGKAEVYRKRLERNLVKLGIEHKINLDQIVDTYLSNPALQPDEMFSIYVLGFLPEKQTIDPSLISLFDNWLENEATVEHRKRYINSLKGIHFKICGEEAWLNIVKKENYIPEVAYFKDLKKIYHTAKINLNISRPQVKTALNQRLFDVPASEGFLLTDYREDLERYFEIGKEVACFRSPEELREKIYYYLSHPDEMYRIKKAAYERVMEDHTYKKRMEELLGIIGEKKKHIDRVRLKNDFFKDNKYVLAHNFLAAAFGKMGFPERAFAHFQKTLEIDENDYDALYNSGNILRNQQKYRQAIPYLIKSLEVRPNSPESLKSLSLTLKSLNLESS
ncbi:MAG: glycosyltransferase [Deltaproteobacteria bacterium]|nr:glycosyltransferase [Deltaproteobacteria bacterium]MBW2018914.1 glycosyltransferase [Deltaproteobacteria bacterium]MBW2073129.1 glycosyltransferase [Deltaproteobacteria bacterium]